MLRSDAIPPRPAHRHCARLMMTRTFALANAMRAKTKIKIPEDRTVARRHRPRPSPPRHSHTHAPVPLTRYRHTTVALRCLSGNSAAAAPRALRCAVGTSPRKLPRGGSAVLQGDHYGQRSPSFDQRAPPHATAAPRLLAGARRGALALVNEELEWNWLGCERAAGGRGGLEGASDLATATVPARASINDIYVDQYTRGRQPSGSLLLLLASARCPILISDQEGKS